MKPELKACGGLAAEMLSDKGTITGPVLGVNEAQRCRHL